jgi:curli biogenesis system outer membrane secretion channel CsgG
MGHIEGNMRVVDARTGDIMDSQKVSVSQVIENAASEARMITELADAYADQVTVNLINAIYPIKVAAVVSGVAYINRGNDGGLSVGETLRAVRPGQPIIDPDTGVQLGMAEAELGQLVLNEVDDARSKAVVGQLGLQTGDILKRLAQAKGQRSGQAAMAAVLPARTGGKAENANGKPLTLAVGRVKINPRARNRRLTDANGIRITNDLMVKLSQFPEFDVMERAEIDQVLDEKTFTAIAVGTPPEATLRQLQGADYLVHTAIDDFMVRLESTKVPYTDEIQQRYFGTVEASVRMVDVHSGKLTSAIKIRIDDRMRNVNSDSMATNDLIDRVTTEMATRISDDLFARQNGELVPIGRRVPDIGQERQPPVKINRPNF